MSMTRSLEVARRSTSRLTGAGGGAGGIHPGYSFAVTVPYDRVAAIAATTP